MRALFSRRPKANAANSEEVRAAPDRLLANGATLGRYEVVRRIGCGGAAEVYEAIHLALKKRVALKVLRPELSSRQDVRARFLREGEIAARIQHPNVVDVVDVGASEGIPFIVMEYLEGQTLAELLARQKRLDVQHIVHIMLPVLAAVAAGHDIHVVHGDLKPGNIFLATDGRRRTMPKVLDFGVSRVTTEAKVESGREPRVIGTPYYMSSEQARGDSTIDTRSDQFALGVILYEASTGRLPWKNRSILGLIHEVRAGDFAPPSRHQPNIDPMLEAVILRAMRHNPADRFEHARAMGAALLRFASIRAREYWALEFGNAAARAGRSNDAAAQPPILEGSEGPRSDPAPASGAGADSSTRPVASAAPRRPQRSSALWVLGAVTLLGGAAAYALLQQPLPVAPAAADAPAAAAPAAGVEGTYECSVRARPDSTRIEFDGAHVGDGVFTARLPLDGASHVIRLTAPGFEPVALTFRDAPPPASIDLVPIATPPPTERASQPSNEVPSTGRGAARILPAKPATSPPSAVPTHHRAPTASPSAAKQPPSASSGDKTWPVAPRTDNRDPWSN
jgi:serine/threonine-protein kinase